MFPVVNVALQAAGSTVIHVVGATGAAAVAANLGMQSVIHAVAVASGPVGWAISGALTLLMFL
jgi:hypothetical protein